MILTLSNQRQATQRAVKSRSAEARHVHSCPTETVTDWWLGCCIFVLQGQAWCCPLTKQQQLQQGRSCLSMPAFLPSNMLLHHRAAGRSGALQAPASARPLAGLTQHPAASQAQQEAKT